MVIVSDCEHEHGGHGGDHEGDDGSDVMGGDDDGHATILIVMIPTCPCGVGCDR